MPRKARIVVPGAFHHVMARGIDGQDIFVDSDDRESFLTLLQRQMLRDGHRLYAWALMPNHYHLLLRASEHSLADTMGRINGPYARSFNKKRNRRGYLFQDRFKSLVTQDQKYVETILRYVHLNPLRAGLCASLDELVRYRWCGHGVLMGTNSFPAQATEEVLRRFGGSRTTARAAYTDFMQQELTGGNVPDDIIDTLRLSNVQTEDLRQPGCWVIGDPSYVKKVLALDAQRRVRISRHKRDGVTLGEVAREAEQAVGLPPQSIAKRSRGTPRSEGRKLFAYLCRHKYEFPVKDIAAFLGIGSSPASICIALGEEVAKERSLSIN